MSLKFGLLFRPQDPPDAAHLGRKWEEIAEATVAAEAAGFGGVFLPEHHMRPDGYCPASLVGLSYLAARTSRIDLGTTVFLLPLYHPVHVAEQSALLDVLSGGRLRLGCGLGNFQPEYEMTGLDKRKQVPRYEAAIDIVQRLWDGEHVVHESEHFTVNARISPRPVGAQLWLGAASHVGVKRVARLGRRWIATNLHRSDVIGGWHRTMADAAASLGRPTPPTLLLRDGWIGDSLKDVEKDWWRSAREDHYFYLTQIPRFDEIGEPHLKGVKSVEDFSFDAHRRDRLVVGSANDCIEAIEALQAKIPFDYLVLTMRFATGPSQALTLEAIRRFGAEVIPHFTDR